MPNLVGIGNSQVPTNAMLGGLAYQDSVGEINLDKIKARTSDTAVDIFVYDTRKDSDGGAWRHRTQNTSWYNEGASATRGARKEFPAVAVIVVTGGGANDPAITIYDGDDPNLPMWMVFRNRYIGGGDDQTTSVKYYAAGPYPVASVVMLNGVMVDCQYRSPSHVANIIKGVTRYNFINDSSTMMTDEGDFKRNGNLGDERNTEKSYTKISTAEIVHTQCNDVAMTVLPNAPIDASTGLPIPTIAVATDGGVSVIKNDNTVISTSGSGYIHKVEFTDDRGLNAVISNTSSGNWACVYVNDIDTLNGLDHATYNNWDGVVYRTKYDPKALTYKTASVNDTISGFIDLENRSSAISVSAIGGGLTLFEKSPKESFDPDDGMVDFITTDYNTGYMHGDIKGAFLSDTDATNVTAVVVNSSTSDWSQQGGHNWTITSATEITVSSVTSGQAAILRLTTDSSKHYVYSFNVTSVSDNITFRDDQGNEIENPIPTSTGVYTGSFTGTSYVDFTVYQTDSATITDINIRESEEDRSVNNKGLGIHGTITKTPVAAGAELVAYSGFNASNGLIQPYNSDLDFGTGDYYMSIWAYGGGEAQALMVREHGTNDAHGSILIFQQNNKYAFYSRQDGTNNWTYTLSSTGYGSRWNHVTMVRTGGTLHGYVNGKLETSIAFSGNVTNNDATLNIGRRNPTVATQYFTGSLALARIGSSAPTDEQIKKIYNDEKCLFHENAKCTLHGTSDDVKALSFDDTNGVLHVGTSSGRSEFRGLNRINNTTTAVTTAISASNELVAEQ